MVNNCESEFLHEPNLTQYLRKNFDLIVLSDLKVASEFLNIVLCFIRNTLRDRGNTDKV